MTSQWNRHTFYTICGRIPCVLRRIPPHPFCSHLIRKLLPLLSWCHFNGWTFQILPPFYMHKNRSFFPHIIHPTIFLHLKISNNDRKLVKSLELSIVFGVRLFFECFICASCLFLAPLCVCVCVCIISFRKKMMRK